MRKLRAGAALTALALVLTLALAACTRRPAPAPTPAPAATASPVTATVTPAEASASVAPPTVRTSATIAPNASSQPTTATAAENLPASWHRQSNDQLSLALPPGWQVISLTGADAQAVFDALKKSNPTLAGIIGGPEALQSAAFWAFGPQLAPGSDQGAFVDSLNVRRSPLGASRVTDIQQVIDVLLPQYEKMGLKVTSTDATLRVNELPAGRLTYTMAVNVGDGTPSEVRGRQVLVATDSDLWILSFTTTPEREGEVASEFEQIAQSFQPK